MTFWFRQTQMAKGWGKEIRDAWDEADHPRGKTTEGSNSGSFAPKGGGGEGGGSKDPERLRTAGDEDFKRHVGNMADLYQRGARGEAGVDKLLQQNYQTAAGVYGNDYAQRVIGEAQKEASRRDRELSLAYKNPHGDKVGIGTILTSSWGYDQTNVDFYEVTGMSKSGKTVTLRGLGKIKDYTGDMVGKARAIPGLYDNDKPITKKLQPNGRVRLTSYSSAGIWGGEDKYFSEYA